MSQDTRGALRNREWKILTADFGCIRNWNKRCPESSGQPFEEGHDFRGACLNTNGFVFPALRAKISPVYSRAPNYFALNDFAKMAVL
jgi:hypothetical protein